jgi:hypothetical protein
MDPDPGGQTTCGSGSLTLDKKIGNWTTQKDEKVREMNSYRINKNKGKRRDYRSREVYQSERRQEQVRG